MICQQVTLSGEAEWPKVADAVIEAPFYVRNNCFDGFFVTESLEKGWFFATMARSPNPFGLHYGVWIVD
jgi:hypothetical protein